MKLEKGTKYLILLIVALLIMYLGSTVYILLTYIPYKAVTGITFSDYSNAIAALQNYYSEVMVDNMDMTWSEYAQMLFMDVTLFENTKLVFSIIQFISYAPLAIVLFYFLHEELREDFRKFRGNGGKSAFIIVGCIVAMYVGAGIVASIYEALGITGESANEGLIDMLIMSKGKWFMIIAVVIMASIFEELIFRKLLIDTCEKKFKMSPVIAIIVSAILFSLIHVSDIENIKFIFQYIVLALPLCVAYHLSDNNIYVTIIMHAINNILSVIAVFAT